MKLVVGIVLKINLIHLILCSKIRQRLKGDPDSVLEGEHGLASATMRGFEQYEKLANLLPMYEDTKQPFIPFVDPCWIIDTVGEIMNCQNHISFNKDKWIAICYHLHYFVFYSTQEAAFEKSPQDKIFLDYHTAKIKAEADAKVAKESSKKFQKAHEVLKAHKNEQKDK
jgi:hypothetical protein